MSNLKVLNDTIPGFPWWPYVAAVNGKQEIIVYGDHLGLGVYSFLRKLIVLLIGLGLPATCYLAVNSRSLKEMGMVVGGYFLVYVPLLFIPRWPHIIGMRLFPSRTKVRFTPKGISIGFKIWKFDPRVDIQFRATRSPMRPQKYNRLLRSAQADKLNGAEAFELEFRLIEMIYGARIVKITNVANQERAQQYAIALQRACELAVTDSWDGEALPWNAREM
jgi:hypothetical protein